MFPNNKFKQGETPPVIYDFPLPHIVIGEMEYNSTLTNNYYPVIPKEISIGGHDSFCLFDSRNLNTTSVYIKTKSFNVYHFYMIYDFLWDESY